MLIGVARTEEIVVMRLRESVLEVGEELVAAGANDEDVLEADAAPAGPVHAGLDRQHHLLLDPELVVGDDARLLGPRGADTVAGVVGVAAVPLAQRLAHSPVDVPR